MVKVFGVEGYKEFFDTLACIPIRDSEIVDSLAPWSLHQAIHLAREVLQGASETRRRVLLKAEDPCFLSASKLQQFVKKFAEGKALLHLERVERSENRYDFGRILPREWNRRRYLLDQFWKNEPWTSSLQGFLQRRHLLLGELRQQDEATLSCRCTLRRAMRLPPTLATIR